MSRLRKPLQLQIPSPGCHSGLDAYRNLALLKLQLPPAPKLSVSRTHPLWMTPAGIVRGGWYWSSHGSSVTTLLILTANHPAHQSLAAKWILCKASFFKQASAVLWKCIPDVFWLLPASCKWGARDASFLFSILEIQGSECGNFPKYSNSVQVPSN